MTAHITVNDGFNFGPTALSQLGEAIGIPFACEYTSPTRKVWYCAGQRFSSAKQLGLFMLEQANTWMIDAGLVNLSQIAEIGQPGGYRMFTVS
jgi:hypothetical protein